MLLVALGAPPYDRPNLLPRRGVAVCVALEDVRSDLINEVVFGRRPKLGSAALARCREAHLGHAPVISTTLPNTKPAAASAPTSRGEGPPWMPVLCTAA